MHNLPAETTSFVGRERELADVKRLLDTVRLVTLTGVGGVGKTRIAVRVARSRARLLRGGSWLVTLSDLEHPELVGHAVAQALGLRDHATRSPVDTLVEYLRDKQLLLVLDTCDRLVDACADLVDRLLRGAPQVRILVTSREPLRVAGEHLLVIPPLAVDTEAVELFRSRAAAVVAGFEPTPAVGTLCQRLDGLPLAIELAAGRLRDLSVEQITERLDDRFRLLASSSADSPAEPRHQTLRAAITWSMHLCEPDERLLWARLAVFCGTFDLPAVEAVCADDSRPAEEVAEHLAALVEKSIVVTEPDADPYRFRLLDSIRDYGLDRLRGLGEEEVLRRRHRDYYAYLVRQAERAWSGPDQLDWYHRLRRERANLWAALEYSLGEPAEVTAGLELAGRLWFFWVACGFLSEGRHYLERALARDRDHDHDGDHDGDRGRGRGRERCRALWAGALVTGSQGDLDTADVLLAECRASTSDPLLRAYAAETQGMVDTLRGDLDSAVSNLESALAYHRGLDHPDPGKLRARSILGVTLAMRGDLDGALVMARETRALCEARGDLWQRSYADYHMALGLRGKRDPRAAAVHLKAAIDVKHRFRDVVGLVMCLEQLAGTAVDQGDGGRAAHLFGGAEEVWRLVGQPSFGSPFYSAERQRSAARARELLGDTAYERAFRAGGGFSLDELVAYALDRRPVAKLTRREREIAAYLATGLSNRDIADQLVIAKRTVDSHVEHILAKLGFSSRAQVAAWVVTDDHGGRDVRSIHPVPRGRGAGQDRR